MMIRTTLPIGLVAAALVLAGPVMADEAAPPTWLPTLITETPEQGFDLAVAMARKAVKTTQPDVAPLQTLRPAYAHDADSLIVVSGVIATYFATVAEANGYWRD